MKMSSSLQLLFFARHSSMCKTGPGSNLRQAPSNWAIVSEDWIFTIFFTIFTCWRVSWSWMTRAFDQPAARRMSGRCTAVWNIIIVHNRSSPAKKIRPLEKKLGRKPATPQTIWRSVVKVYVCKLLGQFLPIIVKIRPQLSSLELGRFLGRWFPRP
jgi:hypothetical protein